MIYSITIKSDGVPDERMRIDAASEAEARKIAEARCDAQRRKRLARGKPDPGYHVETVTPQFVSLPEKLPSPAQ